MFQLNETSNSLAHNSGNLFKFSFYKTVQIWEKLGVTRDMQKDLFSLIVSTMTIAKTLVVEHLCLSYAKKSRSHQLHNLSRQAHIYFLI